MNRNSIWRRIGSNAAANISSGGAVAVSQLGMTAIAARTFTPETFAQWTVLISLAALVPLFGVSLAAIVTRCLVQAEQAEEKVRSAIFMAAQQLAHQLSALALVVVCLVALVLRPISLQLQHMAWPTLVITSVLLSLGQSWQVMLQPSMGWHYARENAWNVTFATGFIRLCTLGALVLAWLWGQNNAPITAALMCAGAWAAFAACQRADFTPKFEVIADPRDARMQAREIRRLANAFAVWSAGSAAIQYGLPAVMSVLIGTRYNAFYLAYTLNLVALGIVGAVATALMAPVSRLLNACDKPALKRAVFWGPVVIGLVLTVTLSGLQAGVLLLLSLLAPGMATGADVTYFIYLLGFQTLARSMALVFSVILSAAGSPRQVAAPILFEIVLVMGLVLPAGLRWGDTTFLVALGLAGLVAALLVAALTAKILNFSRPEQASILARFVGTQALAAGFWAMAGHT